MFSIHLVVALNSKLGQRLGFVQHLMGLAVVRAISSLPGCGDTGIKLKWPNDIYHGAASKIGGVVVSSVLKGQKVHCFIGTGINVSNSLPTTCINDIIKAKWAEDDTSPPPKVTIEQVIARTVSELDALVKLFERQGVDIVKDLYLEHWLHSKQVIRIANTKQVAVEGLDDQGYLLVRDIKTGLLMSVHPDGNRFDMLHNLMVRKTC
jgi:biotin--protein ligase